MVAGPSTPKSEATKLYQSLKKYRHLSYCIKEHQSHTNFFSTLSIPFFSPRFAFNLTSEIINSKIRTCFHVDEIQNFARYVKAMSDLATNAVQVSNSKLDLIC